MERIIKLFEEQSDMKAELARIDTDIRVLKDELLPLRGGFRDLELGQRRLEASIAANDVKLETVKGDIVKDIKEIKEKLTDLPKLNNFRLAMKVGAGVSATIIVAGFTFVGFITRTLLQMSDALAGVAGN